MYGLAALLHDHFFAYSIDMSTAAEEVRGARPHYLASVALLQSTLSVSCVSIQPPGPVQAALCNACITHCDRSQGVTLSRLAASLAGFRVSAATRFFLQSCSEMHSAVCY